MRPLPAIVATGAAALAIVFTAGAATAQEEEGSTPGAIPDPSTYEGSLQLQQQSDQQDQQFRQQQQSGQPTYAQPSYGAPTQPSGGPAYGAGPPRSRSSSGRFSAPRAAPPAVQGALLRLQVGAAGQGAFTPFAGVHLWVTAADPVRALTAAGIQPIGSSLAQLTYDCQVAWVCIRDFKLMTAGAVGVYTTNSAGRAQTGVIQPGRYFVVGFGTVRGGTTVWSGPVNVHPGVNTMTIDQRDGSVVAVAHRQQGR